MGKNFNGTQINQSPTISEKAGADVADIRVVPHEGTWIEITMTATK